MVSHRGRHFYSFEQKHGYHPHRQMALGCALLQDAVNGDRTKPSHNVKIGDTLLIDNGATEWEVVVCGIAEKRGSAAVAQTLYGETAASVEKRRLTTEQHHFFREPASALKGRPTKRDRRLLDQSSS